MSFSHIVFDLDGTLADSFTGIAHAYNLAHEEVFHSKSTHDIKPFIGPPIAKILKTLTPHATGQNIKDFVSAFTRSYDSISYKETILYPGVKEFLTKISDTDKLMYLATNKREVPTLLILEHLNIAHFFKKVYCIDSNNNYYNEKAFMLADLINDNVLIKTQVLMVGDTMHDYIASKENDIIFAHVNYGYGRVENATYSVGNILQLLDII